MKYNLKCMTMPHPNERTAINMFVPSIIFNECLVCSVVRDKINF